MLGTNELKAVYNKNAKEVGEIFEKYFVKTILNRKSQFKDSYPSLLIVAPPVVNEYQDACKVNDKYLGATQKSKQLNDIYKEIAQKYNCEFLSNQGLETGMDGVHLTKESHKKLAEKLEDIINNRYTMI